MPRAWPTYGSDQALVTLDRWLGQPGDSTYDLYDPGDLQVMYQTTVLNQAATDADLRRWLDRAHYCGCGDRLLHAIAI